MADAPSKSTPAKVTPVKTTATPATTNEDAGNLATDGDVVGSTAVPGADVEKQDAAIKEAGTSDPDDHVIDEGVFYDSSTVGAGTILPGGGYGDPLPDPQVQRKNADSDYRVK